MDAFPPIAYMVAIMRLLLLISAFFAALAGGVAEAAPSAQRVEQSARSSGAASARRTAYVPHLTGATILAFADLAPVWHAAEIGPERASRPLYADRLRE